MVERVARALWAEAQCPGKFEDCEPLAGQIRFRELARAAIEAMRGPTEAMIKIGDDYTHCGGSCGNRAGRDTWQAMIDAALNEPGSK